MATPLTPALLENPPDGVSVPGYDRARLTAGILHIGIGNFHRAHQAVYLDRLFELGLDHDWAIVGAGVKHFDQAMRDRLEPQGWLNTVVELDPSGLTARITGAMIDFVAVERDTLIDRLCDPAIRIVSLTVTEGGYYVDAKTGGLDASHPEIRHDAAQPDDPQTVFGILIAALRRRDAEGKPPFTVMSCDNLPENGHVTQQAVEGLARMISDDLGDWIRAHVAFPNAMVDCITPATTDRERAMVADLFGVADAAPVVCEPFRQWVLEDNFPQGRPALEKVGVEFVENVTPYELMKLRILNGGHAAIAYPSGLLGHHFVHDAMADPDIRDWLVALENREIIPTLEPIPGVSYDAYRDKIVERFSNPEVGDTIPRLCLDGSNRQPKFILPTVVDALKAEADIPGLALEIALWCRYCYGEAEDGSAIDVPDELAASLKDAAVAARDDSAAWLRQDRIFGDLGQDPRLVAAFDDALRSLWQQGVRATLRAYIDA